MTSLIDLGYSEIKPNLFFIELEGGIKLYHDFRKGYRFSYAFQQNKAINVKELDAYKQIKAIEESSKSITLDKF